MRVCVTYLGEDGEEYCSLNYPDETIVYENGFAEWEDDCGDKYKIPEGNIVSIEDSY